MQITNNFNNKFNFLNKNFLILIIIFLRYGNTYSADLSYIFLIFFAISGRLQIIQALLLSWFFSMGNWMLMPDSNFALVGRYLIIFACFLSIILRGGLIRVDRNILYTFFLGIYFIVHSFVFSQISSVSILKSVNWITVILTLSMTWYSFTEQERRYIYKWITKFLEFIAIFSLPFLFFEAGYQKTGDNFQGILSHPMVFGPTMAILGSIYLSQLFNERKLSFFLLFKLSIIFTLVSLSASRTAFFALSFVSLCSIIFVIIFSKYKISSYLPIFKDIKIILFALITALLLFLDHQFFHLLEYIITKSNKVDVSNLMEAYEISRGRLFESMIQNIRENPFFGIGFGIASDIQSMEIVYDPIFNLPIQAPVEKGVMFVAIIEEVGVIGFFLFCLWLKMIISQAIHNGAIYIFVIMLIFLLNLAEATLFSPGGMGLINLILLSSAVAKIKFEKK